MALTGAVLHQVIQEVTTTWINATTPLYTVKVGDPPLTLAAAFP